jgi:hypothetical protein
MFARYPHLLNRMLSSGPRPPQMTTRDHVGHPMRSAKWRVDEGATRKALARDLTLFNRSKLRTNSSLFEPNFYSISRFAPQTLKAQSAGHRVNPRCQEVNTSLFCPFQPSIVTKPSNAPSTFKWWCHASLRTARWRWRLGNTRHRVSTEPPRARSARRGTHCTETLIGSSYFFFFASRSAMTAALAFTASRISALNAASLI